MAKKVLVFLLLILISVVYAVPGKINYQGRLMENGNVVNGNKTMSFYLYINGTETELLANYSVGINNGIYNVELPVDQASLPSKNEQVYLRVYIDGNNSSGTRLSPDVQLVALPYAIHSNTASYADNADSSSKIQGREIANTAPGAGQVLKWNGSAWAPAADVDTNTTYAGDLSGTGTSTKVISLQGNAVTITSDGTTTVFAY